MEFRWRLFAALLCCLCLGTVLAATPVAAPVMPPVAAPPPPPPSPRVAFETSLGRIVVELYPQRAPKTVANFLGYARSGHYNGTVFHRAIYGVLVQGGSFTPDHQYKPTRKPVASEATNGLRNTRGTLAAARRAAVVDSADAGFYLNLGDNDGFDHKRPSPPEAAGYTVFGRVVEGLQVADRIAALPTGARAPFAMDVPVTPVVIESTEVLPLAPVKPALAPEDAGAPDPEPAEAPTTP